MGGGNREKEMVSCCKNDGNVKVTLGFDTSHFLPRTQIFESPSAAACRRDGPLSLMQSSSTQKKKRKEDEEVVKAEADKRPERWK